MRRAVALGLVLLALAYGVSCPALAERDVASDGRLDSVRHPPADGADSDSRPYPFQHRDFREDEENGDDQDEDGDEGDDQDDEEEGDDRDGVDRRANGRTPPDDGGAGEDGGGAQILTLTSTSTPTPTPTPTSEPTSTPSPTPTQTATATPTPEATEPPWTAPRTSDRRARFHVSAAALDDASITAGETVQVTLQVENVGERDGTFEGDLIVDGERVASKSVPVEAGGTETVAFERRFDKPGEYEIAVGDTSLGTLTVTDASDDGTVRGRADADGEGASPIEVVEATAPADWVKRGYETTVKATVVNTANRTANRTLTVTVDGRSVANATVTLRPNERDVVSVKFEAVGGAVAVEGVDAGRIEVSETVGTVAAITDDTAEGAGPEIPIDFVLQVAAVAVVGTLAAVQAVRR